jgi:DNA polymerase III delta subunit
MAEKEAAHQIIQRIESSSDKPSGVLLVCPDLVRRQRLLDSVLQALLGKAASGVPTRRFRASEMNLADVSALREEINSPSLFSAAQVFIVEDVEDFSAEPGRRVHELVQKLPPGVFLVLTAGKLPATSILRKYFSAQKLLLDLASLETADLRRWLKTELNEAGIEKVSEAAVNSLLRLGRQSPDSLSRLVAHAALYVENGELQNEDLEALFIEHFEPSEFELVDALGSRNRSQPEVLMEQIIKSGKSPFALLGMLSKILSNYLIIRLHLENGERGPEIQARLSMNPWVFGKYMTAASRYDVSRIKMAQAAVLRADSRLKNKNLGPQAIFSELISVLAL